MKCIEDEISINIPKGWSWTKIDNIAFVTKLAGFEYTNEIAPNLCKDGIPLFKGKNVQNGHIFYQFESYIPEEISNALYRSQINRKCILTPYVGTIGNIGIHNRPGKFHLGSNVGKIELYNEFECLLEEYVVAYLQSDIGYKQLTKHKKATAQESISIEAIRDVFIPIPPSAEQQRICTKMQVAFQNIDLIRKEDLEITSLISLVKSRILDLAIRGKLVSQDPNDEPASVLLECIRAEKEDLIKQGKIKRGKKESVIFKGEDNSYYIKTGKQLESIDDWGIDMLPDNWEICCLGELCDYGNCINVETADIDDSAWILDLEDIEKDTGRIVQKVTKRQRNSVSTKHRFHSGQVLYSKLRPYLNKVVLTEEDGYCTSEILPLDFAAPILPSYARYYLMSPTFLAYADRCSYGVKMPRLSTEDGKKSVITVPPLLEQQRIVTAIENCFDCLKDIVQAIS